MTLKEIALIRLQSQQLTAHQSKTPHELVSYMGAMQAQDYAMSKWAVGIRLPGTRHEQVEHDLTEGRIIRTHLLRPTWHLAAAEDVYWMLDLTAPQINAAAKTRHKQLELTPAVFTKSAHIITKALEGGKHLTRDELMPMLHDAGIGTDDNRSSHILMHLEMEQLICSGGMKGKQTTYALLSEHVSRVIRLNRDESLAKLAGKYFNSHFPATMHDFTWWSGLSVTAARQGFEDIRKDLVCERVGNEEYWLPASFQMPDIPTKSVHLLPAYDEYLISYKDRTASLVAEHQSKAFSNNGIFFPTILVNGQVVGLWKRTVKKDTVQIEVDYFQANKKAPAALFKKAATAYAKYLGVKKAVWPERT